MDSGLWLPLQALWLPQWILPGCLHTTFQRKSAEIADMLRSSVNTQVASCYRALHVSLMGLTVGRAQENNSSPQPQQHCCKASNSSNLGHRQRSHHMPVGTGCWSFVLELGQRGCPGSVWGFVTHSTLLTHFSCLSKLSEFVRGWGRGGGVDWAAHCTHHASEHTA